MFIINCIKTLNEVNDKYNILIEDTQTKKYLRLRFLKAISEQNNNINISNFSSDAFLFNVVCNNVQY